MAKIKMKAWVTFEFQVVDDEGEELGEHYQTAGSGLEYDIFAGAVTFEEGDTDAGEKFYARMAKLGDAPGTHLVPFMVEGAKTLLFQE